MSTFAPTQTPSTPEVSSVETGQIDVFSLANAGDTTGEPYIAQDRFQICDHIGGNMSVLYNAIDLEADTAAVEPDSVVKVLLHADEQDPYRDVLGEVELAVMEALPSHPNIIGYLGQGSIAGFNGEQEHRFIAMERANFGTWANPKQQLSTQELEKVLRDIGYGLAHLEEFHLVHVDVKPSNIGLHMSEGGEVTGKLLDFGSARPLYDDPASFIPRHSERFDAAIRKLHEEDIIAISRAYASPEISRDASRLTNAADVYSLGCSIVEMFQLSESLKAQAEDEEATIAVASGRAAVRPDISVLPDRVPPNIGKLLYSCLAREPEDRIAPREIPQLLAA